MLYARNTPPVDGAQWTGIVTQIALEMLASGEVEAVVCVQSGDDDRFEPKPVCDCHLVPIKAFEHRLLSEPW